MNLEEMERLTKEASKKKMKTAMRFSLIWCKNEWTACDAEDEVYNTICRFPLEKYGYGCAWASEPNAECIVKAHEFVLWTIERIRYLEKVIEAIRDVDHPEHWLYI